MMTSPETSDALPHGAPAAEPHPIVEAVAPQPRLTPRMRRVARGLALVAILVAAGAVMFAFAFATVHRRTPEELSKLDAGHGWMRFWLEHGYLDSAGLIVMQQPAGRAFYRSSTGAVLLPGFVFLKIYSAWYGKPNWRLLPVVNQLVSLCAAVLLALVAFRLARRFGVAWHHALALAVALEAVFFTFPDNLMLFWDMQGRIPWLCAACAFLLLEDLQLDRSSRALTLLQGVAGFFVGYMEFVAGLAFTAAFAIAYMLLGRSRPAIKRLVLVAILPVLLAVGVHRGQIAYGKYRHPEYAVGGSEFAFRTGFDGSTLYYVDHLAIANFRNLARANFNTPAREHIFRWKWLFFAGVAAVLAVGVAATRGRVPRVAMLSLLSLLGAYLLYAALFSQAVVIHPYYYDVMLFTPLALALFVLVPSLVVTSTRDGGVVIVAAVFLAAWVSMVQMRKYAITYPRPPVTVAPK
jgi:hypothetical protein